MLKTFGLQYLDRVTHTYLTVFESWKLAEFISGTKLHNLPSVQAQSAFKDWLDLFHGDLPHKYQSSIGFSKMLKTFGLQYLDRVTHTYLTVFESWKLAEFISGHKVTQFAKCSSSVSLQRLARPFSW
ncbi:uncharacterized protein EV154DRAFT_487005 [Mucor mucedo]|uniref:uncharacterized protein n=1 Tax=Mucor mucedo TaxID=29922 RepID=UPI002220D9B0|nr:uncharacterized protein EV154DRAFT_487005 [Mucor mucedo]KAI7874008.1 hypothetical protein EV154DRAFT_487005 [Mucor mucedo]